MTLLRISLPLVSILLVVLTATCCQAWLPTTTLSSRQNAYRVTSLSPLHSTPEVGLSAVQENSGEEGDDDEEEYEYIEYEMLTEPEFMRSEWLVGTVMDNNPAKISETWVRLATDKDGKNVAIWGDNAQGSWNFDVANQFLSISKENLLGKKIWAGVVDDYYFSAGTVRGWNFFSPAAVLGQWQAKRLGVDKEEAGTAPWFEVEEEETTSSTSPEEEETTSSTSPEEESEPKES